MNATRALEREEGTDLAGVARSTDRVVGRRKDLDVDPDRDHGGVAEVGPLRMDRVLRMVPCMGRSTGLYDTPAVVVCKR